MQSVCHMCVSLMNAPVSRYPPPPPRPPRSSFTLSGKTRTIEDHLEDRMVKVAESMNCYWKSYNTGIILRFVNF